MSENASHIFIHHYIDSASNLFFGMACCIALIVVVVLITVILLGITIYLVVVNSKKCRHSMNANPRHATRSLEKRSRKNLEDDASSCNALGTPASTERDFDGVINPNVQDIPLSTFRKYSKSHDKGGGDSSESSAGLYDVLFPEQHEGEIVYEPPVKLVTFAGQVYPSSRNHSCIDSNAEQVYPSNRKHPCIDSNAGPSSSGFTGVNCDNQSGSLDWDYFQQNLHLQQHTTSVASEVQSEVDPQRIHNVCWV